MIINAIIDLFLLNNIYEIVLLNNSINNIKIIFQYYLKMDNFTF